MRLQSKKVSARATALALVLGVVAVLVTAIPAYALTPTITGIFPVNPAPGCPVTLTGTNFQLPANGGPVTSVTFTSGVAPVGPTVIDSDGQLEVPVTENVAAHAPDDVLVTNSTGPSAVFDFLVGAAGTCPGVPTATPNTGAVNTVITLTGTFTTAPTAVRFNTMPAVPLSTGATTVTVAVPAGATTGPVHVYTATGESHTTSAFVVSGTGLLPTITGFSHTCGSVGTAVTVNGTNLTGATSLRFNATTAVMGTNTGTSIATTVPTGATTGVVSVTTPSGSASSPTSFTIPCATTTPLARTVSFGFDPNSRVSGQVNVTNGTAPCHSLVPVIIQKQKGSTWKWADTTATRKSGSFKTYIPPSGGNFRAKINKITLVNGVVCGGDTSNVVHS